MSGDCHFFQYLWFLLTDFNTFPPIQSEMISAYTWSKIYYLTLQKRKWHSVFEHGVVCSKILYLYVCNFLEFTCANGQCVSLVDVCEGYRDFGDFSDEYNCPTPRIYLLTNLLTYFLY